MKVLIPAFAAIVLFTTGAFAQGSIAGRVTDAKGKPVASVTLTAADGDGNAAGEATTGDDGAYSFEALAAGKYTIVARAAKGFRPAFRDNVIVNDDETATVDITLAADAGSPAEPVEAPAPKTPENPALQPAPKASPLTEPVGAPEPKTPVKPAEPKSPAQPAMPAIPLVDEIIAKHIEALGGPDLISRIRTIYLETNSQVMGNDAPGRVTILDGKGFRSETDFNGSKMIQCYTDKGGWATNPMSGNAPELMPDEQYRSGKAQLHVGGELFDYAAKGSKAELLGKDGGLYKIKLTTRDAQVFTYYIDAATYLVAKIAKTGEVMGQQVEAVINYSDYKKTDYGFTVPYTTRLDLGTMYSLTTTTTKVEINKPVDPKIFEMPK